MKTFCAYFNAQTCSSCRLIETGYQEQLRLKENRLKDSLATGLQDVRWEPSVGSAPMAFRNKAKMVVTGSIDQPIIGLEGKEELDQGREILSCPLHHPKINQLLVHLKNFIQVASLVPYHRSSRKGELKGFIIFHSQESDEMYLRFVLRSKEALDRIRKNLPLLQQEFPHLVCVSVNVQPVPHAILEGEEEIILTERRFLKHTLGTIDLQVGPRAFVQTNQSIAFKLYSTAADWVKNLNQNKFAELYCGQGAFSFFVSPFVKEALGIEINQDAVQTANETAQERKLQHLKFKCKDAADVAEELTALKPDIVLVNPPRKGLGDNLRLLLQAQPSYIIYSSCSHESLSKDLQQLVALYNLQKVQIFDMFPHTEHFETLVLLKSR